VVFPFCFVIITCMKKIVSIVLVLACLPLSTFWYMEDRLFCRINQDVIKVSINSKDGSKCQSYIAYIEQTMRKTARELYTIQWYINKKQDVQYWSEIKAEKLASIDTLQGLRLDIIANMKSFELWLLRKSVDYFTLKVAPYRQQLTNSLAKLSLYTWNSSPEITRLITLMSWQVQTIDKIAEVQTFEELLPLLNGYIYFKKEISWKSE